MNRRLISLFVFCVLLAFACSEEDPASTRADADVSTSDTTTSDADTTTSDATTDTVIESRERFVDLIRGDRFPRLVLEVDATRDHRTRSSVESDITDLLGDLLDKPGGVTLTYDDTLEPRGSDYAWTFDELDALARERFDLDVPDDTIRIHILVLDGRSARDSDTTRTLGLAWSYTHLVLFKDTIEDTCDRGLVLDQEALCAEAELGILVHEVGHLLGLVDNGLPMQTPHRDPDTSHGAHDASDSCIMYYAFESGQLVDRFAERFLSGNTSSLSFGPECLADIAAVRDAP